MLPGTPCCVARGDIGNEKSILTLSLVKLRYNAKQVWKLMSCLLMEIYIILQTHFAKIC
jgi:hypothetical protein